MSLASKFTPRVRVRTSQKFKKTNLVMEIISCFMFSAACTMHVRSWAIEPGWWLTAEAASHRIHLWYTDCTWQPAASTPSGASGFSWLGVQSLSFTSSFSISFLPSLTDLILSCAAPSLCCGVPSSAPPSGTPWNEGCMGTNWASISLRRSSPRSLLSGVPWN